MINIPLDFGYAFDHLSICRVKLDKSPADKSCFASKVYNYYANNISEQIGDELFYEIISSTEYVKLLDCNKILFETIDNLKKYKMDAKTVDLLNHRRFELKAKLQKKFFPGKEMFEFKLGY